MATHDVLFLVGREHFDPRPTKFLPFGEFKQSISAVLLMAKLKLPTQSF